MGSGCDSITPNMIRQDLKKFKDLPDSPGVYYFLGDKKQVLYIGKATSLKDRVKSYFTRDLLLTRGLLIEKMIAEAHGVRFVKTDSVLEALMLETAEIKKYQPIYNTKEKDDKSYNYVVITKEDFPRVLIVRGRNITTDGPVPLATFGPYPNSSELRSALKIVRKIFPFRDKCTPAPEAKTPKKCFNAQIGLCPGVCSGKIGKREYRKIIKHLKMFFEGKKPKLVKTLEKEMGVLAKRQKFEEAEQVKRTIYALEHIEDVALIKRDLQTANSQLQTNFRIEAYDIAHLGGKETVGVMTVVLDGELDKSQYRKFKIRGNRGNNDIANLKEVLERRFGHSEWQYPNLIVVDGGKAQINIAQTVQKAIGTKIPVVSVVKDERHRAREILWQRPRNKKQETREGEILLANAEAHRFAIKYHRKLRQKGFRI